MDENLRRRSDPGIPPFADDPRSAARAADADPTFDEVAVSWTRSARQHGVDPVDTAPPRVFTAGEIRDHRAPIERLIVSASTDLDRLYMLVRSSGYALLFCDMTGAVVEHRGDSTQAEQFSYWGTWLGGLWSESVEGTNGIGTCIAEERPVTVHRGQHFRSRNKELSCSGAPVFGIDGRMMAVLDVSAIDPTLSERAHGLTGMLTIAAAEAVAERYFREHFRCQWVIAAVLPVEESTSAILLAVDDDQRLVGANRIARKTFALDDHALRTGVSLWHLFERDPAPFRHRQDVDTATQFLLAGSSEALPAIVTPPLDPRRGSYNPATAAYHAHPRTEMLSKLRQAAPLPPARGGLPPAAVRRVKEFVDLHMGETIDLAVLAGIAGLSVYHFAREFKRTTGTTPHFYLIRKRIERAQHMLARTELSLAEIALAVGFSDQSHLARHFRHIVGQTPREFRWSQR
ncbi:MAG TPA: helix-turn-helix domain-containing protein [Xanthobacteraceae bacterium]|nr:helix-turn-helix domain-containing protein [Xanthobacteraceae bacterium]